jgi:hypothetical protein
VVLVVRTLILLSLNPQKTMPSYLFCNELKRLERLAAVLDDVEVCCEVEPRLIAEG